MRVRILLGSKGDNMLEKLKGDLFTVDQQLKFLKRNAGVAE